MCLCDVVVRITSDPVFMLQLTIEGYCIGSVGGVPLAGSTGIL
jgi:hypothetical protein